MLYYRIYYRSFLKVENHIKYSRLKGDQDKMKLGIVIYEAVSCKSIYLYKMA